MAASESGIPNSEAGERMSITHTKKERPDHRRQTEGRTAHNSDTHLGALTMNKTTRNAWIRKAGEQ